MSRRYPLASLLGPVCGAWQEVDFGIGRNGMGKVRYTVVRKGTSLVLAATLATGMVPRSPWRRMPATAPRR